MKNQILVLDDDTRELRKLREILTKEGFNIITATDKETAIELSRHIKFEFVLGKASALGFEQTKKINDQ
ncbi:MAG: response regulator [Ignavibacteriales bacterium]|nr:MAG: response regulator [Ignavibacteriales bacterium]